MAKAEARDPSSIAVAELSIDLAQLCRQAGRSPEAAEAAFAPVIAHREAQQQSQQQGDGQAAQPPQGQEPQEEQQGGPEHGNGSGFLVDIVCQDESADDQRKHDEGLPQQCPVGNGVVLVVCHHPLPSVTAGS